MDKQVGKVKPQLREDIRLFKVFQEFKVVTFKTQVLKDIYIKRLVKEITKDRYERKISTLINKFKCLKIKLINYIKGLIK